MFGFRRLLFIPTLLAAIAAPYLLLDGNWQPALKQRITTWIGGQAADDETAAVHEWPQEPVDGWPTDPPGAAGPPVDDLRQLLRFDLTPHWVTTHWGRVTTVAGPGDLMGLRVSVVTGTDVGDLAGSMTYYFDAEHRLQRIAFHGHTGDERKLVHAAKEWYHMRPEPTLGAGVYIKRWNGRATSVIRLRYAPVVRATQPRSRLLVQMEINRAELSYGLSPEFQSLLGHDRNLDEFGR